MLSSGRVFGDVKTAKLKIADGRGLRGTLREMIKSPEKINVFSAKPREIKKSVHSA